MAIRLRGYRRKRDNFNQNKTSIQNRAQNRALLNRNRNQI